MKIEKKNKKTKSIKKNINFCKEIFGKKSANNYRVKRPNV